MAEIEVNLPPLGPTQGAFSVTVAQSSLPYLRNCIKENFRITTVLTMPLARRVRAREGVVIDGHHIEEGVRNIAFDWRSSHISNSMKLTA